MTSLDTRLRRLEAGAEAATWRFVRRVAVDHGYDPEEFERDVAGLAARFRGLRARGMGEAEIRGAMSAFVGSTIQEIDEDVERLRARYGLTIAPPPLRCS